MARKKRFLIAALIALAWIPMIHAAEPKVIDPSSRIAGTSSQSGSFIAFSEDRKIRTGMLRAADEALKEWEKIHTTQAGTASPIILNDKTRSVAPRGAGAIVPLVFETETGTKVQVDVYEESAFRSGAFESGVLTALALHAMHIDHPPRAGAALAMPPQWLIEGLSEELRRDRSGTPEGVYSALIQSGRPPNLTAFLAQKPEILDAASIVLYRAQALGLVRVLQKSPSAKSAFSTLLKNPTFATSELDAILSAFPSLRAPGELTKLWTLSIARDSMPPRVASLDVEQSEKELVEILKSVSATQSLPEPAKGRGGAFLMNECAVRMFNLQFLAHPLYQPIAEKYRMIATILARKPKTNVSKQLAELEATRALIVERSQKISDYLNWFEVTQLDDPGFNQDQPSQHPKQPAPQNPYALHLDSIESRGW